MIFLYGSKVFVWSAMPGKDWHLFFRSKGSRAGLF
jgi:hypothetical protein